MNKSHFGVVRYLMPAMYVLFVYNDDVPWEMYKIENGTRTLLENMNECDVGDPDSYLSAVFEDVGNGDGYSWSYYYVRIENGSYFIIKEWVVDEHYTIENKDVTNDVTIIINHQGTVEEPPKNDPESKMLLLTYYGKNW